MPRTFFVLSTSQTPPLDHVNQPIVSSTDRQLWILRASYLARFGFFASAPSISDARVSHFSEGINQGGASRITLSDKLQFVVCCPRSSGGRERQTEKLSLQWPDVPFANHRRTRESSEQGIRPSANWFAAERRPEGSQTCNVWIEVNLDLRAEGSARLLRASPTRMK